MKHVKQDIELETSVSIVQHVHMTDIALISEEPEHAQLHINMACDYAYIEGYQYQPIKSVALNISYWKQKQDPVKTTFTMGLHEMSSVKSATLHKRNMIADVEKTYFKKVKKKRT